MTKRVHETKEQTESSDDNSVHKMNTKCHNSKAANMLSLGNQWTNFRKEPCTGSRVVDSGTI